MQLHDAVVFITGANRGIGRAFADEALRRGARTVYAAARDPAAIDAGRFVPIALDVTNPLAVAAAARRCADSTIVVNNAGIAMPGGFLAEDAVEAARRHFEVNFFGPLHVARAFAPVLGAHGGGALVNVLSIASWISSPRLAVYGASKSAAWSLTNGLRNELRAQGTQVLGLHVGFVDTDMTRAFDVAKTAPAVVAQCTFDALEAGASEVLADERTANTHRDLTAEPAVYLCPPE